jgi:hypothetical protein
MRIARDVVVASEDFDSPEDSRVRAPSVPQKLDDGNYHRYAASLDSAEDGNADETSSKHLLA